MKYVPHAYQDYTTSLILENKLFMAFLDCGLGKTVITLTAIAELLHNTSQVSRVLVIAPLRVAENIWEAEARKWDHLKQLRLAKVLGPEKKRLQALKSDAHIYVINRENVKWLVDYCKHNWPFDMVVLDELSSFKSPRAQRFKALRKVRPLVKRVVGLTGTPAPNGLLDLWSQVYLLDRGERLGKTLTAYRQRYFLPDKRSRHVIFTYKPKEGAETAIYNKLSDICISMKSGDYLEIPQRVDNVVAVQLPPKAMQHYRRLERDLLLPLLEGDVVAGSAAVLANKLLQLTGGAVYDENGGVQELHAAKLNALADLVEAANGKPVLVYYSYRHDLQRIQKRLGGRVLSTPGDLDDWNRGAVPLMLAHPATAGHGLNLQAGGSTIIWFGLPWSLELYQQANARIHRQGQKDTVVIHHLVAKGTIDEDVMQVLAGKQASQAALLEAVRGRGRIVGRVRKLECWKGFSG